MEIEKIVSALIKEIDNLQERIQELENRKPLMGSRGPAGDITAALQNVEVAAPALVEAGLKKLQITTLRGEKGEPGRDGQDGQSIKGEPGRNAVAPTIELVESLVATAMQESKLLDETGEHAGPLLKYAIETALKRLAVEK
jgi:hypothetical protein